MNDSVKNNFKSAGFDVEGTIRRFAGNEALYEKYIFKFIEDKIFESLTTAVKAGNHEDAFKESHTLKGVSGNLGLESLADASSVMCAELRDGKTPPLEPLYKAVEKAYNEAIAVLNANK